MPIVRMFRTNDDATEAAADLGKANFGNAGRVGVQIVSDIPDEADMQMMRAVGLTEEQASEFAQDIEAGGVLLVADAPFGTAGRVAEILERPRAGDHGTPQALETRAPRPSDADFGDATPLSTFFQIPVLLADPAPLSSYLKWPTLRKTRSPMRSSVGLPLLSEKAAPLSSLFGIPVLSSNAAPLSSSVGAPVLSQDATPLSTKAKVPTLSDDATPLSSKAKLPTLSNNATPLSSLLGLPVLWR